MKNILDLSQEKFSASRRRLGFTLIELLVVIAIIAILAAMLLPALNSAKLQSMGIKCLSNQKQMVLGWLMYAQENKEQICVSSYDPGVIDAYNSWVWCKQEEDYSDNWYNYDWNDAEGVTKNADWAISAGPLYPYINNYKVYMDPSDTSVIHHVNVISPTYPAGIYPRVRSVSMNFFLGGFGGTTSGGSGSSGSGAGWGKSYNCYEKTTDLTLNQSPGPVNTWVFTDERQDCINWGNYECDMLGDPRFDGIGSPGSYEFTEDMPGFSHANSGCFAFADGHSELHHWLDNRTYPPIAQDLNTSQGVINGPAQPKPYQVPRDVDVNWLMFHSVSPNDVAEATTGTGTHGQL